MSMKYFRWNMKPKTFEGFKQYKLEYQNELSLITKDGIIELTQDEFADLHVKHRAQLVPYLVELELAVPKADSFDNKVEVEVPVHE